MPSLPRSPGGAREAAAASGVPPWRSTPSADRRPCPGAERSGERGRPRTYEVLGFIIDFDFNYDFLRFPMLLFGFPRMYIRLLS